MTDQHIKTFSLRTILSAVTGRLMTEPEKPGDNGIGRLYSLLGHMTGEPPFTHQLPRFADECKPWLLRWFPELTPALACEDKLDKWLASTDDPQSGIVRFIAEFKLLFPNVKDEYEVGQIPRDDHAFRDPIEELEGMVGRDRVIVVSTTDSAE